jgi:hypothetical protein
MPPRATNNANNDISSGLPPPTTKPLLRLLKVQQTERNSRFLHFLLQLNDRATAVSAMVKKLLVFPNTACVTYKMSWGLLNLMQLCFITSQNNWVSGLLLICI